MFVAAVIANAVWQSHLGVWSKVSSFGKLEGQEDKWSGVRDRMYGLKVVVHGIQLEGQKVRKISLSEGDVTQ